MAENKTFMISARVAPSLVERTDYVVRNTDDDAVRTRSQAVARALETWVGEQEKELRRLGVIPEKTR
jgi:hypothetical protein